MAAAPDKQAVLVAAIASGVKTDLTPEFKELSIAYAKLQVTLNSINARLEMLEAAVNAGGCAPKRNVRPGGARGATKAVGANPADAASRVTNALLYFRYAMGNDLDDSRATFGTEENMATAEGEATVGKKDKNKDEYGYWSAVGAALWKAVLSDGQKEEIRNAYKAWGEESKREAAAPQLESTP